LISRHLFGSNQIEKECGNVTPKIRKIGTVFLALMIALSLSMTVAILSTTNLGDQELQNSAGTLAVEDTLISEPVVVAPTIDGDASDAAWDNATAITIELDNGIDVSLKSVYTADNIYFLATWEDGDESIEIAPWSFDNTTKEWIRNYSCSEDQFAMMWNISMNNFSTEGASATYVLNTTNSSELVDLWQWKSVQTNPVEQMDDRYINSTGIFNDTGTSETMNNTQNLNSTDLPLYWAPNATVAADGTWILKSDINISAYQIEDYNTTNYSIIDSRGNETYANETTPQIAGMVVGDLTGDRADITAKGSWANDIWTLEICRALDTADDKDAQFDDTGANATYHFGVAVFNNSATDCSSHAGDVYELTFAQNNAPSDPVITVSAETAEIGVNITFSANATDLDNDTLTYAWDFNDSSSGSGAEVNHSYDTAGNYTVTVTASDGRGGTSQSSVNITITEVAEGADLSTELLIGIIVVILIIAAIIVYAMMSKKKKTLPPSMEEEPAPEIPEELKRE